MVAAATVADAVAGLALLVAWTVLDDPCPGFESEGPMVSPASAYGRVMCEPVITLAPAPMSQVELTAASLVVLAVALVAGMVTALATGLLAPGRPRGSRRLLASGLVATLRPRRGQTTPSASIASATLRKPAMLAPAT